MRTPYLTRSGIQIGIRYCNPLPVIEGHALIIQSALLERHAHRQSNVWHRIVNSIYRWL